MKKVVSVVSAVIMISSAQAAVAADGEMKYYVAAEGGYAWVENSSGGAIGDPSDDPFGFGWYNTGSDTDNHATIGVKAGIRLGERFRVDLGYTYYGGSEFVTKSEPTPAPFPDYFWHSEADIHAVMFSAYYNYAQFEKVNLFVGAGLGASFVDFDAIEYSGNEPSGDYYSSDSDTLFAWQLEAGVDYLLSDDLTLYGGFRYVDLGEIDAVAKWEGIYPAGNLKADLDAQELYVGLRYSF